MMDDDEESKEFGGLGGANKLAAVTLSANQLIKDKAKEQATKYKQIQDFKVRVLDFVAIYIKEVKKEGSQRNNEQHLDSLEIIKGLLRGLQVAHLDRNMILFERIKSVISMMARGSGSSNTN